MSYSKRFTYSVLALSGTTIALLLYAVSWTKSADLSDLPPILTVIGNFHPILLHLPIGVFVYLGLIEAWNFLSQLFFKRGRIPGGLPMLAFGTVSAVLAAFAGLLLYLQGGYSGELIDQHMNWGTGFAISALVVLSCALFLKDNSQASRIILFASIAVLSFAAHQGGLITHGDPLEPLFAEEEIIVEAKPVEELITYEVVDKIFQSKCYNCHSVGKKQKGGLLMDSYEALLAGGKKGNALVSGSLDESKLSTYLHLPLDDEHHMPPEGKPQLTEEEIAFIDQWILAGASSDGLLIDQGLPEKQRNWAIVYMGTPIEVEEPAEIIEEPDAPSIDFDTLIADIEQRALNSITRVGPNGEELIFSAINASNSFDADAVDTLIKLGPYLIDIDLSNTTACTCSIQRLMQASTQLKRLKLSGRQVNSQSIESLVGHETLESLVLFNTQVAANTLPVLKQLVQLDTLYLGGTRLESTQVEEIRQALPNVEVVADDFLIKHSPTPPEEAKDEPDLENPSQ